LVIVATVNLVRFEKRLGRTGKTLWMDLVIVWRVLAMTLAAHLIEIGVWAICFLLCGEMSDFGTAYYYSAGSYTTLGTGDVLMTPSWRLLGPMEAADGVLMFGVSTALVFLVGLRLAEERFADIRR